MTIDAQLLAAILERPLDDAPRLVAADALQEKGDPRGELVVAQCRLAESGVAPDERAELSRRASALLAQHEETWAAGAKGVRTTFRRGFVDAVEGAAAAVAASGGLFAREPVTRLEIGGVTAAAIDALAAAGAFARVVRLTLRGTLGKDGATRLAAALAQRKTPLLSLNVGGAGIDAAGAGALASALTGCRSLVLTGNAIGDDGLAALAKAKPLASLDTLYASDTSVSDEGVSALAKAATFTGLRRLSLARNEELTEEGLRAIARSKKLRRLVWLEYTDPDEGAQRIVTRG